MGYLNNTSVTVDMILTKKGRELLAKGKDYFQISQFALADDEIDYGNWNPNHPLGSNYYGEIIDNMPVLEAISDETQVMKYKLVTYNKNITRLPVITVPTDIITLYEGQSVDIRPQVNNNFPNANATFGYTFTTSDKRVGDLIVPVNSAISISGLPTVAQSTVFSEESVSHSVIGKTCTVKAMSVDTDTYVIVQVYGNETGGFSTVQILVKAKTANQLR